MRDIGKNIRQLRTQLDMTQDDLAERIHATRQTVSNYETGRSRPDIDTLLLLAEALECEIECLLYGEAKPTSKSNELRHLLWCAGLTAGIFLLELLLRAVFESSMSTRYQLPMPAACIIYLCRFLWPTLLGWTVVQAAIALRLVQPQGPRWLHFTLVAAAVLYIVSFFIPVEPLLRFWRLLMVYHLFPTEFPGGLVLALLGATARFTRKA